MDNLNDLFAKFETYGYTHHEVEEALVEYFDICLHPPLPVGFIE